MNRKIRSAISKTSIMMLSLSALALSISAHAFQSFPASLGKQRANDTAKHSFNMGRVVNIDESKTLSIDFPVITDGGHHRVNISTVDMNFNKDVKCEMKATSRGPDDSNFQIARYGDVSTSGSSETTSYLYLGQLNSDTAWWNVVIQCEVPPVYSGKNSLITHYYFSN